MFKSCLLKESPLVVIVIQLLMILFKDYILALVCLSILMVALLYFYRVPSRPRIRAPYETIVSPSDGTVLEIESKTNGYTRIAIYLSPLDVHLQWYPTYGVVVERRYVPGQFNLAYIASKSRYNERVSTLVRNEYGVVRIDQIAGQLARRIVNTATLHTVVRRGEHMGMIKLSSRVDVHVPSSATRILVKKGDTVVGNLTRIAEWISHTH